MDKTPAGKAHRMRTEKQDAAPQYVAHRHAAGLAARAAEATVVANAAKVSMFKAMAPDTVAALDTACAASDYVNNCPFVAGASAQTVVDAHAASHMPAGTDVASVNKRHAVKFAQRVLPTTAFVVARMLLLALVTLVLTALFLYSSIESLVVIYCSLLFGFTLPSLYMFVVSSLSSSTLAIKPPKKRVAGWDSLPVELQLAIIAFASPLTRFLCSRALGARYPISEMTIKHIWDEVIASGWDTDLLSLPQFTISVRNQTLLLGCLPMFDHRRGFVEPAHTVHVMELFSRSIYVHLCERFPALADVYTDRADDALNNEYLTSMLFATSAFTQGRLRDIAMRNNWFDLLDYSYPIALGWHAIFLGNTAMLKHLVDTHGIVLGRYATGGTHKKIMDFLAEHGYMNMLQMLHDAGCNDCSSQAMDHAAHWGNLDMLKFLHTHRTEGCTTLAIKNAALARHVHVVWWLIDNRSEGVNEGDIFNAARDGRMDAVHLMASAIPDPAARERVIRSARASLSGQFNGLFGIPVAQHAQPTGLFATPFGQPAQPTGSAAQSARPPRPSGFTFGQRNLFFGTVAQPAPPGFTFGPPT